MRTKSLLVLCTLYLKMHSMETIELSPPPPPPRPRHINPHIICANNLVSGIVADYFCRLLSNTQTSLWLLTELRTLYTYKKTNLSNEALFMTLMLFPQIIDNDKIPNKEKQIESIRHEHIAIWLDKENSFPAWCSSTLKTLTQEWNDCLSSLKKELLTYTENQRYLLNKLLATLVRARGPLYTDIGFQLAQKNELPKAQKKNLKRSRSWPDLYKGIRAQSLASRQLHTTNITQFSTK